MAKLLTLTAAEKKLIACTAEGDETVFLAKDNKTGTFDIEDPLNDPANGATWPASRTIRAEILRRLLVDPPQSWPVHANGVRIIGARITGELDLAETKITCPLYLLYCHVEQPVSLLRAETKSLFFRSSHIPSIDGVQIKVTGNVNLDNVVSTKGGVSLAGAEIGGQLSCNGATFENEELEGFALNAQQVTVKEGVFLEANFSAKGGVSLLGAEIGGQFNCNDATFENESPKDSPSMSKGPSLRGASF